MAKPKSTKVDKATALKLAQLADAVMSGDYSNGFLYRAQEDRADFFAKVHRKADDSTNGNAFIERMQFGKLWEDKDYAFRVVCNPVNRERFFAELADTPVLELLDTHRSMLTEAFDLLAAMQPADVITDANYDDNGFWQEFSYEAVAWVRTGEIDQERIDDYLQQ